MPQGIIEISKVSGDVYRVKFLLPDASRIAKPDDRTHTIEEVRRVLTAIGVPTDTINEAVKDAIQKSRATIEGFSLTAELADELGI